MRDDLPLSPDTADECRGLAQILGRVGDKWTVIVVGHLSRGTLRFNAIQKLIPGLSHRVLTITLRGLERDGLVSRKAFATIPPRVDYELTPLGRSLTEPLALLAHWASTHRIDIEASQEKFDLKQEALPKNVPS